MNQLKWAFVVMFASGALIGSVGGGILANRFGGKRLFFASVALLTAPFPFLLLAPALPSFYVAFILVGLGSGGLKTVYPLLARDLFGTNHIGLLIGILPLTGMVGNVAPAYLSSFPHDLSGPFTPQLALSLIIGVLGTAFAWLIPDRRTPTSAPDRAVLP